MLFLCGPSLKSFKSHVTLSVIEYFCVLSVIHSSGGVNIENFFEKNFVPQVKWIYFLKIIFQPKIFKAEHRKMEKRKSQQPWNKIIPGCMQVDFFSLCINIKRHKQVKILKSLIYIINYLKVLLKLPEYYIHHTYFILW